MIRRLLGPIRYLLLAAALLFATTSNAQNFSGIGKSFTCSVIGQAASLLECQALVSGRTYVITDVKVQSTTATSGTFAIQSGTGTNCGTGTAAVFPSKDTSSRLNAPPIASAMASLSFNPPLVVTKGHAICVIGVATNTISIQISGYYSP